MEMMEEHEAKAGDIVTFELLGDQVKGKVIPSSCKRCIMVDLSIMENFNEIEFEHQRTIVAPGKYKVLEQR